MKFVLEKWLFPVARYSNIFSSSSHSVCSAESKPLEKHCYWMSHQRTFPQLIPTLLYHVFVHTWPTAFVNMQWKQSQFHCFYNDILIDWCYLLAGLHSSFSFISIDFSTPLADSLSSNRERGQRVNHYVLSVWMVQLFTADKKDHY